MNCIIFYHHPNPTTGQANDYTAVQMRAGRHWRPVYVRTELVNGDVEAAQKHAEAQVAKGNGEMVLKVVPYETQS